MTRLDDALEENMADIVLSERRPFCYRDFLKFEVNYETYGITHGTFRNKICKLRRRGKVELSYYSSCAFYTIKGHKFGKPVTPNHTVVHSNHIYKMLQHLPLDKRSIHDIHLKFKVPGIWEIFSVNANFPMSERSKDIVLPSWSRNNAIVRTVIHRSDVVSVVIGCSLQPIPLDFNGIIRFFTLLAVVETKVQTILDAICPLKSNTECNSIPLFRSWIVTMWHFGRDASVCYAGEKFSIEIGKLESILTRLYVKDFGVKNKIRLERQEYPNKTVLDAIEEKLGCNILG
jgi:hypothetical protein